MSNKVTFPHCARNKPSDEYFESVCFRIRWGTLLKWRRNLGFSCKYQHVFMQLFTWIVSLDTSKLTLACHVDNSKSWYAGTFKSALSVKTNSVWGAHFYVVHSSFQTFINIWNKVYTFFLQIKIIEFMILVQDVCIRWDSLSPLQVVPSSCNTYPALHEHSKEPGRLVHSWSQGLYNLYSSLSKRVYHQTR